MPNYARAIGGDVEHIDLGFEFRVEIWLATHPEVAKSARHRGFIDFLTESFDERKFPWFGPDSMSPKEIETQFSRKDLSSYFEGSQHAHDTAPPPLEIVTLETQDELDRLRW